MRVIAIGRMRRLRGKRHNRRPQFGVRRQHPMKANEMQARAATDRPSCSQFDGKVTRHLMVWTVSEQRW